MGVRKDLCACGHPHVNPDGTGSCSSFLCPCLKFQSMPRTTPSDDLFTGAVAADGQVVRLHPVCSIHRCGEPGSEGHPHLTIDGEIPVVLHLCEQHRRTFSQWAAFGPAANHRVKLGIVIESTCV